MRPERTATVKRQTTKDAARKTPQKNEKHQKEKN